MDKIQEMRDRARQLVDEAIATHSDPESTAEDLENARKKQADAGLLYDKAAGLAELTKQAAAMAEEEEPQDGPVPLTGPSKFKSAGHYLLELTNACHPDMYHRPPHEYFSKSYFNDENEGKTPAYKQTGLGGVAKEWESKDLLEQTGASGGFLVPPEFLPELIQGEWEQNVVRQRAIVIPMRRRQINVPALDQTGTTAGEPHQYGGVVAEWTEEAGSKPEKDPQFRQIQLVAHKLSVYTEISTELLADSAIGLAALLGRLYSAAIAWEEDYAFLRGTGVGQPLGVINAGATWVEPRAVAGTVSPSDFARMLMHFQGSNPCWHMARSALATLVQLNGPAANPSYIFMPGSFVNSMPDTLFGYPIYWTEKLPLMGVQGDVLLADWKWYYIGDREATTIDSSSHYRFRYNLIAYRADHRVDGQPMISQPFMLADGATQVSPFVILGDVSS